MVRKLSFFKPFSAIVTIGLLSFNIHAEEPVKIEQLRRIIQESTIENKQEILSNAYNMETSEQQHYLQRKVDALRGFSDSAISYELRNPNALKDIRSHEEGDFFSNISQTFNDKNEAAPSQNFVPAATIQNTDAMDDPIPSIASVNSQQENLQAFNSPNTSGKTFSRRSLNDLKTAYAEKHPDRANTLQDEFKGVPESEQVAALSRQLGYETNQYG